MINQTTLKITSLVLYVITYNVWYPLKMHGIHGVYYKGCAFAVLLIYIAFKFPVINKHLDSKVGTIGIMLAISNIADELFFDPTAFQWNEYLSAALILIFIICGKRQQSKSTVKAVFQPFKVKQKGSR